MWCDARSRQSSARTLAALVEHTLSMDDQG
jgi:hypothetical protein